MSKLSVFNFVTANGFFEGEHGDISWSSHDEAGSEYATEMLEHRHTLLFGRVTYQQMASFWPTAAALKMAPVLAAGMNNADKIVFSRTLTRADWRNSRVMTGDLEATVKKMKDGSGANLTVLGSGSLVTQLARAGLVDEFGIMVNPVFLGAGTPILSGLDRVLKLELVATRAFKNGNVLLSYRPVTG
jgi:dihydrofolate reductase